MHDERATVPEQRSLAATLLRPKVALPLTLLVLALVSPLIIRGWNLSRIADLDEPALPPRAPSIATPEDDTALHHFRLAVEKSVGPYYEVSAVEVAALQQTDFLRARMRFRSSNSPRLELPATLEASSTEDLLDRQQVLELIERNEVALNHWRLATERPFEPTDELLQFLRHPDNHQRLRFLFSLSILRSEWLQSEGRIEEAWMSWISDYRYHQIETWLSSPGVPENEVARIENLIARAQYEELDHWMIDRFEKLVSSPDLTPELSRRMLADLDAAREQAADLDWLVQQSYERTRQRVLDYYASVSTRREAAEAGSVVDAGSSVAGESRMKLYIRGEPEISLRVLKHHYAWLRLWFVGEGKHGNVDVFLDLYPEAVFFYKSSSAKASHLPDLMTPEQIETAFYTRAVCLREVGLECPDWAIVKNCMQCQHELLKVYLAQRWFQRTNGEFPNAIAALIPDYLPAKPVDPFDPEGGPLALGGGYRYAGALEGQLVEVWRSLERPDPFWTTPFFLPTPP